MRFYCPLENISEDKIVITDRREIHHILDVLRLKENDSVCVFDGKDTEYQAVIEEIFKDKLILRIKGKRVILSHRENLQISVGCAIPKRRRFEFVIEKLTELGIKDIIPLKTERTEVLISRDKEADRLKHWQRIALSACKQSKRIELPRIEPQTEFKEILKRKRDYDLCLICAISDNVKTLKEILKQKKYYRKILVLIGPEGDFSKEELKLAEASGFIPVSLGNLVLRVETAAIAICAFLRLYEDD
ncbi:MAG: 16S rRNA (uracil(1498)-N(3))-methyltransferase [Candidatus Omnitrophica bacterium]|nr:16S rRNA (uracil(1498)-N(3))-methyltransferase [Candidatus Omnitrophota bacterium]